MCVGVDFRISIWKMVYKSIHASPMQTYLNNVLSYVHSERYIQHTHTHTYIYIYIYIYICKYRSHKLWLWSFAVSFYGLNRFNGICRFTTTLKDTFKIFYGCAQYDVHQKFRVPFILSNINDIRFVSYFRQEESFLDTYKIDVVSFLKPSIFRLELFKFG